VGALRICSGRDRLEAVVPRARVPVLCVLLHHSIHAALAGRRAPVRVCAHSPSVPNTNQDKAKQPCILQDGTELAAGASARLLRQEGDHVASLQAGPLCRGGGEGARAGCASGQSQVDTASVSLRTQRYAQQGAAERGTAGLSGGGRRHAVGQSVQRACIAAPHGSVAAGAELAHGAAQIAAL